MYVIYIENIYCVDSVLYIFFILLNSLEFANKMFSFLKKDIYMYKYKKSTNDY